MNPPMLISERSFQMAWKNALKELSGHNWSLYNLIVHIEDPVTFEEDFHREVESFCDERSLLRPKAVAYTIFPHGLYAIKGSAEKLFEAYNRNGGMYQRIRSGWGTYFRRMTYYETQQEIVNQLGSIIEAIRQRRCVWKAAYEVMILRPGSETIGPRGTPCLNYLAIQMKRATPRPKLGMLCIYRSHDILERGYGNYWGLSNLLSFLATETSSSPGPLTVVSSHAFVSGSKSPVLDLIDKLKRL